MARVEALVSAGVAVRDACEVVGIRLQTFYQYRARLKKIVAQARENAGPMPGTVENGPHKFTPEATHG